MKKISISSDEIELLKAQLNDLKLENSALNKQIIYLKLDKKDLETELQLVEKDKEIYRKSYDKVFYYPTLKVICGLIKMWVLNKLNKGVIRGIY